MAFKEDLASLKIIKDSYDSVSKYDKEFWLQAFFGNDWWIDNIESANKGDAARTFFKEENLDKKVAFGAIVITVLELLVLRYLIRKFRNK